MTTGVILGMKALPTAHRSAAVVLFSSPDVRITANMAARIGLGDQLLNKPELANDPTVASRLLASFLGSKEVGIKQALLTNDLARSTMVNGGSHGLDRFSDAFRIGMRVIPENLALVRGRKPEG